MVYNYSHKNLTVAVTSQSGWSISKTQTCILLATEVLLFGSVVGAGDSP